MSVKSIRTFPSASSPVLLGASKVSRYVLVSSLYLSCSSLSQDKETNPSCERFAASPFVPECYLPPEGCSRECMDQAANQKCPRQVMVMLTKIQFHDLNLCSQPENMVLCLKKSH